MRAAVGRERRERVSQLAWCGAGCFDARRRVNSDVGQPTMTEESSHNLRRPRNDNEWRAYHAIRREVLFENRGCVDIYNENHPDELGKGNHPLILVDGGVPAGV